MIHYTGIFLIALIFLSKLSFRIFGFFPKTLSPIIFQYGLHPFINLSIQFFLGIVILTFWFKLKNKFRFFSKFYFFMILITILLLSVQTILQIVVGDSNLSFLYFIFGLIMATSLIFLYGIALPSMIPAKIFINTTLRVNFPIIFLSIMFIPFHWSLMQKGGRFIGLYKHIPHLVTASSISFMFQYYLFFKNYHTYKNLQKGLLFLGVLFYLIASILTFTKATYISLLMFIFLSPFFLSPKTYHFNLFKTLLILCSFCISIFLGHIIFEKIMDYSTGKSSIGLRQAQNGVESRTEEIYRGLEILKKSPMLGLGIMYKYASSKNNEVEVDSYNSFKDPHNFFVSAGVIGGIPLMIFSFLAYLSLIIASIKSLLSTCLEKRFFGLIIFCHLPVFIIYHLHLSMGGVADRVYWLLLGFLAKKDKLEKT